MYDFETMVDRRAQGSIKWNMRQYDNIPLSTADTDFLLAPEIVEGLEQYVKEMVFGYTAPTEDYYNAIIGWYDKRHNTKLKREWLFDSSGVLNSINQVINAFTQKGDGVLIMEPVYHPFKSIIKQLDRKLVVSDLKLEDGLYSMDFEDLKEKLKEAKLLIFCSPHNPIGRVWTTEELKQISDLCDEADVLLFSDEIHSDIIMEGYEHTVFSNINPNSIVASSASKSFNLAGLQTSFIIISNAKQRDIFGAYLESLGLHTLNAVGPKATELAFNKGEKWLDAFNQHVFNNHQIMKEIFSKELDSVGVIPLQGTYLQWLDFSKLFSTEDEFAVYLEQYLRMDIDPGSMFSDKTGLFMRVNIAVSKEVLLNVCKAIIAAYKKYCDALKG